MLEVNFWQWLILLGKTTKQLSHWAYGTLLAKEEKRKYVHGSVSLCKVKAFAVLTNILGIYCKGDGKSIKLSLASRLLSLRQIKL